jgi:hypothetical protein
VAQGSFAGSGLCVCVCVCVYTADTCHILVYVLSDVSTLGLSSAKLSPKMSRVIKQSY